jgi:hypothetical protein
MKLPDRWDLRLLLDLECRKRHRRRRKVLHNQRRRLVLPKYLAPRRLHQEILLHRI